MSFRRCGQVTTRFLLVVDEGPEEHYPPRFVSRLANQEITDDSVLLHTKISASPCVAINWWGFFSIWSRAVVGKG